MPLTTFNLVAAMLFYQIGKVWHFGPMLGINENLSRGVKRRRNKRFRQTGNGVSTSQVPLSREHFIDYNSLSPDFAWDRLQEIFSARASNQAAQMLDQTSPAFSAKRGLSEAQQFSFAAFSCCLAAGLAW